MVGASQFDASCNNAVGGLSDGSLSDAPPLLPAGEYLATYVRHETGYFRSSPKVYVHLRIAEGEYRGVQVYRAYRVHKVVGKPKRFGRFKVHHSHALYRQLVTISGVATRPDRVSLAGLKGCLLKISVRTVTHDAGGQGRKPKPLPEPLRYSVVDELLSIEAGSIKKAG